MIFIETFQVENVSLVERFSSRRNALGSLYLTATHVIYVDHDNKRETWVIVENFLLLMCEWLPAEAF